MKLLWFVVFALIALVIVGQVRLNGGSHALRSVSGHTAPQSRSGR